VQEGAATQREAGSRPTGLRAFGLSLIVDTPPPGAWEAQSLSEPIMHLRSATPRMIAECWSGLDAVGWEGVNDGALFVAERGRAGDHRFVHGVDPAQSSGNARSDAVRAVHHLSADASVLQCAPSNPAEPSWWRVVLDSVLFTVALLQGYEALHAAAVATPDGVIAITAATGGGKSTLLAELLRRGLALMADDVLVLESRGTDAPLAHPAPPLMTVPAVRIPVLGQAGLPETICSLEEERWIAVPVHPRPLPLMALVVLNRSPGLATDLHRPPNPLAALMSSLLRFPRIPERERTRFELASAIASHIPIWELSADPSVAPETLADVLRASLIEHRRARTQSRSATV
jgi:hypothetical protein